jgi:hypothetical protein
MRNKISGIMVALVFGGALAAGTLTSCDDDNNNANTGTAGTGGSSARGGAGGIAARGGNGGSGGTGTAGAGGTSANMSVYNMQLSGSQEVPANPSTATATVTVTLNRTTGEVTVSGNFNGLTSNASAAHIHGPAAVGINGPILVPLTVPASTSGTVTGTGTMTNVQMDDMTGGMTYINIHSTNLPNGEIRAQIVP